MLFQPQMNKDNRGPRTVMQTCFPLLIRVHLWFQNNNIQIKEGAA